MLGLARGKPLIFTIEGEKTELIINSITAEDGSCKSWIITGFIVSNTKIFKNQRNFKGYFHYNNRKGHITLID